MSYFKGPDVNKGLPEFQPNTSVLKLFADALCQNGENVAIIEGQTGKSATFTDLLQNASAIAAGLRSVGVTAGDYVIICCDKSIVAFSSLLGITFTGATAILYPLPHVDIVPKMTRGYPIKAVICDSQFEIPLKKSMKEMLPQPVLFATTDPEDKVMASLLTPNGNLEVYDVKDVKTHVPMIFYSSGTTGEPKGIMITDVAAQLCGRHLKLSCNAFFISSPLFWLSAIVTLSSAIFKNFKFIASNSTEPKENLALVQKYKVDIWFVGTGSLPKYINEPTIHKYDLSSVEGVASGGEIMLSSVAEGIRSKVLNGKAKIITGYGSTEGGMLCSVEVLAREGRFEYGLCGTLNAGVEIKIVNDAGEIVPIGGLGDVWVKSPGVTTGYWGRPELNKEVFNKDGFFQSGDVGFFNEKGQLFIRGRKGDVINYKGEKISPAEVEDILMSHEAVMDAAVVGKPHPLDIQHMTAYVVLNHGFTISEKDIESFVNSQVAENMKLIGGVHFLDVLPRTIIGKVKRKALREL